jgi:ubiquinone/menaquinone biosynthesis C-methylase UbiE
MELAGLDLQFSKEVAGAAKAADIDLIEGNVESVPLGGKRYDLVLMSQLIEHLYAPRRTLQRGCKINCVNGHSVA